MKQSEGRNLSEGEKGKAKAGIVYVLTNAAMPGLVKIGMTEKDDVGERLNTLYSTGVPVPFDCEFACRVADARGVERALHKAFVHVRENPAREFFIIESEQARVLLELVMLEDVTPEVSEAADQVDPKSRTASDELRRVNRPRFDFGTMGIDVGSELRFRDGDETCRVADNRKVEYDGRTMSLTRLTMDLIGARRSVAPTPYWMFEDESLKDIYDRTYPSEE